MLPRIALLTLIFGTSPLFADPRHVIGHEDGVSFDYTADLATDGKMIFRGMYLDTGEKFELTVTRRGHVDGVVGYAAVSFDVPQNVRDRAVADLLSARDGQLAESTTQR